MRNLLEEFHSDHGLRPPTILGVREHVFTGRYLWLKFCSFVSLFDLILLCLYLGRNFMLLYAVSHLWRHSCPIKKLVL